MQCADLTHLCMTLNVDKFRLFLKAEVFLLLGELGSGGLLDGVHGDFPGAYGPDVLIALTLHISLRSWHLKNEQTRKAGPESGTWLESVHTSVYLRL